MDQNPDNPGSDHPERFCSKRMLHRIQTEVASLEVKKAQLVVLQALCADLAKTHGTLPDLLSKRDALKFAADGKLAKVKHDLRHLPPEVLKKIDELITSYLKDLYTKQVALEGVQNALDQAIIDRNALQSELQSAKDALNGVKAKVPALDTSIKDDDALNKRADSLIQRSSSGEAYAVLRVLESNLAQIANFNAHAYFAELNEKASLVFEADGNLRASENKITEAKLARDLAKAEYVKAQTTRLADLLGAVRNETSTASATASAPARPQIA